MNYERTADDAIYINEDRLLEPKETFKQIAGLLDLSSVTGRLVDIGCATGEFLAYARTLNSDLDLVGVEYSPSMVDHGNQRLNSLGIELVCGDANQLPLDTGSCDIVTTIGVTSIFDDFRPSYEEMIRVTRSGGRCLNHMLVNEEDVDVIIRYLNSEGERESGWNRFSLRSIRNFLEAHPDVSRVEFIKHEMPFDIEKRDDPMRSWTRMIDGKRVLWNGIGAEVSLYHVMFFVQKD